MSGPTGLSDRILVLGDESKSVRAIERLLCGAGYAASALGSFDAARQTILSDEIALIIIEITASRLTGPPVLTQLDDSGVSLRRLNWASEALQFCNEIRSNRTTAELPILVITRTQRAQDKVACLNSGATDCINSPYHRTEFLSRVRVHLKSGQYERERKERFQQLNILNAVSSVLASSLEPEVLLRRTLRVLVNSLGVEAGIIYLFNSESRSVNVVAAEGFAGDEQFTGDLIDLYFRTAPLMDGGPLVLEPLGDSARIRIAEGVLKSVHGLLCAPLGVQGNRVGAVCLFSCDQNVPLNQHSDMLAALCNQLSVALDNARLYVETKKGAAQLSFVYNLGNNLMTSLEMDELLGYAVFTVGKSLGCDACAVVVKTSADSKELASAIYSRRQDEKQSPEWYDAGRIAEYLGAVHQGLQASIDTRIKDRFLRDNNISIETIVPLVFDDALLGMLICGNYAARQFSADDQKLLGAVAQQLSLAIRNTELYQRTKDTSINLAVEVSRRTKEIEEQKRFTEKIIDSLPVSLYVVDQDMRIVAWNRNREVGGRGINREEVLGKNVFTVLAQAPRRILENEFTEVFRSGDIVRMEQESWLDGQKKAWKISKIPMRVDNAEVTHVITVGEDVTEQKKMNEAVIHAEKLASIGRLAAGVVHEINNPLATIAACAEALTVRVEELQAGELNYDFKEYLQIIRDEAFRCKTITNSLLDFSHQRQAEKLSSDINQIIDQTLQLIRHHPKLGRMNVVKELDESLPQVYVNEGQMKQIFLALISNAYDAMEGQGTLTIRTCLAGSEIEPAVCAEFIDTGCGIPAADLPKIFDPFFTTKPLGRGTGLGLSVCYGIVSEHGGKIEVESADARGSIFKISLPAPPQLVATQDLPDVGGQVLEMESAL